jgi:hypothetical protein
VASITCEMDDVSPTGPTGRHQVSVCVTTICDTVDVCCNFLERRALMINGYVDYVILQNLVNEKSHGWHLTGSG